MDPQSITILAAGAVTVLSSWLAKASEATAKKVGEDVYSILKEKFSKGTSTREALNDLENNPTDSDIQAVLRVQLKKQFQQNPAFAKQIKDLLDEGDIGATGDVTSADERGVAVGGDNTGNILTGDLEVKGDMSIS